MNSKASSFLNKQRSFPVNAQNIGGRMNDTGVVALGAGTINELSDALLAYFQKNDDKPGCFLMTSEGVSRGCPLFEMLVAVCPHSDAGWFAVLLAGRIRYQMLGRGPKRDFYSSHAESIRLGEGPWFPGDTLANLGSAFRSYTPFDKISVCDLLRQGVFPRKVSLFSIDAYSLHHNRYLTILFRRFLRVMNRCESEFLLGLIRQLSSFKIALSPDYEFDDIHMANLVCNALEALSTNKRER